MPVFLLCVRAELEALASINIKGGASFCIDVQEGGGAEVRQGVHISAAEDVELQGSKGTAHFAMKFGGKGSKKEATVTILDLKGVTRAFTAEDADKGTYVPIAAFECRGLEPIGYRFEGDWVAEAANSSTKWDDVDLSEGEWTEYDEKASESVGIFKLESMFKLHKM